MGKDHDHLHYTPSSVGALMDPGFLRQAVRDAVSPPGHHSAPMPLEPLLGWHMAMRSVIDVCLHRMHP